VLAFGLLAFVAELTGRALTAWIDVGRHVRSPATAGADYYPFLLVFVKLAIALLLARLAWRIVRARAIALAAQRTVGVVSSGVVRRPGLALSPRLWLAFFVATSLMYLMQTDAEHMAAGRWPPLDPWLHSSALPVFAVLAVVLAVVWHMVQRWLADYERYADAIYESARRGLAPRKTRPTYPVIASPSPRRLFGLAFESRPPPLSA
jgi:hypothetical protein